jgi:hypothetical protein
MINGTQVCSSVVCPDFVYVINFDLVADRSKIPVSGQ